LVAAGCGIAYFLPEFAAICIGKLFIYLNTLRVPFILKPVIQPSKTLNTTHQSGVSAFSATCRCEEAGQLAVADMQEENGIHFIRINDDETLRQNLKNEGSRRRVPLHTSVVHLGFLHFVQKMQQAGHARIFHTLTKSNSGYGDSVGKWFGRLVTKVGLLNEARPYTSQPASRRYIETDRGWLSA
jgi:hypothetical protein